MKGKFFIDTNIFIYSFDSAEKEKQEIAVRLIQHALENGQGVISYQVIQECLNVLMQKFKVPLSLQDSQLYLEQVLVPLCEVFPTRELYSAALNIKKETTYSFYDSLIVASAIDANCQILYSEDLQNGRSIKGLKIINPFEDMINFLLNLP